MGELASEVCGRGKRKLQPECSKILLSVHCSLK
ncbi:hypothetical protein Nmel_007349 [Mimus melanotis]